MPIQYTNIVFKGNSVNCTNSSVTTNANIFFCENSINNGYINSSYGVFFLDCSTNLNDIVSASGCFSNCSVNYGTLSGNFIFKSGSVNYGIVPQGTCFEQGAINDPGGNPDCNTFYFKNSPSAGGHWEWPESWYLDSSFNTPANQMPTSGSIVCIPCQTGMYVIACMCCWNQPSVIYSNIDNSNSPGLSLRGYDYEVFSGSLFGCALFDHIVVKPNNDSCLRGCMNLCSSILCLSNTNQYSGNRIWFTCSSQNCGVLYSGLFGYNSKNRNIVTCANFIEGSCNSLSGVVLCCAVFSGFGSYNNGTVSGNASFYCISKNCISGRVCSTGCFFDTTTNEGSVNTCLRF